NPDDDLLREVAPLAGDQGSRSAVVASLSDLGEPIVPVILRLAPSTTWPTVVFVARSTEAFSALASVVPQLAMRSPAMPIAVAVSAGVWTEFLTTAPESRAKALLREGEVQVPIMDAETVERTLNEAGATGNAAAALATAGADAALVEAAVGVV